MSKIDVKQRDYFFDNIKGILIFLVVFGHSLDLVRGDSILNRVVYDFIYLFHMPVFIFISGYFSKNSFKGLDRLFSSFIIPFLIFNTIGKVAEFIFLRDNFNILVPTWAMWFLISMFIWKLFLPYLSRIRFILPISLILGTICGVFLSVGTELSLSRTIVFLPFFLVGYFIDKNTIEKIKSKKKILSILIIVFTAYFAIKSALLGLYKSEFLYGSDPFLDVGLSNTNGIILRILYYLIAFMMIYAILNICTSKKCVLTKIGQATLPIYILHIYTGIALLMVVKLLIKDVYVQFVLLYLGSLVLTYLLATDLVKNLFFKFLDRVERLIMKSENL